MEEAADPAGADPVTRGTDLHGATSVQGMDNNSRILISHLRDVPHPNVRDVPIPPEFHVGIGEVLQQARIAHHLLDLAGVPRGEGYDADLDARVMQLADAAQRLMLIDQMHQPDRNCDGHGGNSGYCVECELAWPCATAKKITGDPDPDARS